MKKAPKVGERVRFHDPERGEPVTGEVLRIYPKRTYLEADDDPAWDDPDFLPTETGYRPEQEWQVSMRVDAIPAWWPYAGTDRFAPDVRHLHPL